MKKLFIAASLLIGMIAGAMVLSSFTTNNDNEKVEEVICYVTDDDGWEDWTTVRADRYVKRNGVWKSTGEANYGAQVQRRVWCGDKEYRIKLSSDWYPVTDSPVDGYKYCAYNDGYACCFNM